jgi:hypothetical protein
VFDAGLPRLMPLMAFGFRSRRRGNPQPSYRPASRNTPVTVAMLFLAVGTAVICIVCGGVMYYFQPHVSEDPADVQALMAEMLTISIPQSPADGPVQFRPHGTIRWNLAFMMTLRGAYFETVDEEQDGVLMFLEVDGSSLDKPNVRNHVERVLREREGGGAQMLPSGDPEIRSLHVRRRLVDFQFETGIDPATSQKYRLVSGVVTGNRGGEVLIALRIKEAPPWDDALAERMIESIE